MAETRPHFQQQQYEFAAHLRDPQAHPIPAGIEDRRMKIYRDLFFNSASSLLASTYPVLSKILGDAAWKNLIRDYYASHVCHTPLFPKVPQELLKYLREERGIRENDPPFLAELAHYEWVELALSISEQEPDMTLINRNADLLSGCPVLSPLAWPLAYTWPVHKLSPTFQPQQADPQPTFLVVYRTLNDAVGFLEINAITARLLELIGNSTPAKTGRDLFQQIAEEINHPKPDTVINGGLQILENLRQHDIVLGCVDYSLKNQQ